MPLLILAHRHYLKSPCLLHIEAGHLVELTEQLLQERVGSGICTDAAVHSDSVLLQGNLAYIAMALVHLQHICTVLLGQEQPIGKAVTHTVDLPAAQQHISGC